MVSEETEKVVGLFRDLPTDATYGHLAPDAEGPRALIAH
jgi:hypothetical protein